MNADAALAGAAWQVLQAPDGSVAAIGDMLDMDENTHVVTGEIKIAFLRAARSNKRGSRGTVLKSGKKLSFCEAEVWSTGAEGRVLIAKASTSMIHIPEEQG